MPSKLGEVHPFKHLFYHSGEAGTPWTRWHPCFGSVCSAPLPSSASERGSGGVAGLGHCLQGHSHTFVSTGATCRRGFFSSIAVS